MGQPEVVLLRALHLILEHLLSAALLNVLRLALSLVKLLILKILGQALLYVVGF